MKSEITFKTVSNLFDYESDVGILRWKRRDESMFKTVKASKIWNSRFAGKEALSTICPKTGVKKGTIFYENFYAHDVVWLLCKGEYPNGYLVHKNGNRSDNRIENLCVFSPDSRIPKTRHDVTPGLLKEVIDYNPSHGTMTWKDRPGWMFKTNKSCNVWNNRYQGKPALSAPHRAGYLTGSVFGFDFLAHRAAWAIHYGQWPLGEIDHINGDKRDNRIENMRDVDHRTNMTNTKIHSTNKSGCMGVMEVKSTGKWMAKLWDNGRQVHLGFHDTKEEAIAARKAAETEYGYHENHGSGDRALYRDDTE
jgi:hypothetical protein